MTDAKDTTPHSTVEENAQRQAMRDAKTASNLPVHGMTDFTHCAYCETIVTDKKMALVRWVQNNQVLYALLCMDCDLPADCKVWQTTIPGAKIIERYKQLLDEITAKKAQIS